MEDATRAQRCLTRLCELTASQLLVDLWPIVLRIARLIDRYRNETLSPVAMHRFETELADLLCELGRRIVQWTLNQLEPHDAGTMSAWSLLPCELFWENDHYRRKRLSPTRNLNCLFGKIRVWRWLYEPTEGVRLPCLFPLELQVGWVAGVATPALGDRVARLSVDFSQRQVLAVLRAEHHVCWGVETLRKVTVAVAEAMSPFRHTAQVAQVLAWLNQAASEGGPRRIVLSVGRDGLMLPIRLCKKYKEGATATLSVFNRRGKRLGTVYLGQMPEEGQVTLSTELTHLIEAVLAAWQGPPLRLVYVTDAGFHPSEYFEKVLCRMLDPWRQGKYLEWEWVVDYYHACKYIGELGEAIFGPGREAHAWAAKMRRWLKEKPGGVYRVLRSAGALVSIRGLVGEESDYESAYNFLRRHAPFMNYHTCRRLKVPIGSGVTEAACKIVFSQRFKRAGMKWNREDGALILVLRVIELSNVWTAVRNAMLESHRNNQPHQPRAPDRSYEQSAQKAA